MDIYLSVNNGKTVMVLPVMPSEFEISKPQNTSVFETVSKGELQLIGEPKLKSISFSSFFPIRDYPFLRNTTMKGWEYVDLIDSWIEQKLPVRLVISDTPINMAVAVKDFSYSIKSDGDLWYSLDLEEFNLLEEVVSSETPIISELNEEIDMEKLKQLQSQVEYLTGLVNELSNPFIYNYMDENMPSWAKPSVQKMIDKGVLDSSSELELTYDLLRVIVWLDRLGLLD